MTRPFTITEYVRWGDIDLAGIIFYGAYLRFFEIGETELFRAAGVPHAVLDRLQLWLPRRVMHSEFLAPARLDEALAVHTYISRLGTSSLTINYDVRSADGATVHATGHQVLVCVARDDFGSRPLPAEVRTALTPFVMTPDEARAALLSRALGG